MIFIALPIPLKLEHSGAFQVFCSLLALVLFCLNGGAASRPCGYRTQDLPQLFAVVKRPSALLRTRDALNRCVFTVVQRMAVTSETSEGQCGVRLSDGRQFESLGRTYATYIFLTHRTDEPGHPTSSSPSAVVQWNGPSLPLNAHLLILESMTSAHCRRTECAHGRCSYQNLRILSDGWVRP